MKKARVKVVAMLQRAIIGVAAIECPHAPRTVYQAQMANYCKQSYLVY
jgi:hypothetical protein